MDLLLFFLMGTLVVFFGIVPPVLVGIWAYLQGKKGYDEACDSRDVAMLKLDVVMKKLDSIKVEVPPVTLPPFPEIPPVTIPDEVIDKMTGKIMAAIKGTYGSLIRWSAEEGGKEIDKIEKEQIAQMDPSQRVQNAIMAKMMSFLE